MFRCFQLIDNITSDIRCSDLDFKVNVCEAGDGKFSQVALKDLIYDLIPSSFVLWCYLKLLFSFQRKKVTEWFTRKEANKTKVVLADLFHCLFLQHGEWG